MASRTSPGRRTAGMLRVPFVRRCKLAFDDGTTDLAFSVNINVLGAYLARDALAKLGQTLTMSFRAPDRDTELVMQGVVTWVNPRQQHPVHSLPPGFGVKFVGLGVPERRSIEGIVDEYAARNPQTPR